MDEANDGTPGSSGKYVVPPPFLCFKCDALAKAQAEFRRALEEAGSHDHGQYQWTAHLAPTQQPQTT
ncbi:hypothetical protein [Knoellia sp. LjRoot47]|uniref:hypothetical protein n=1 Tax=Knoellia sp. LjRoot47 TaxID=3342330 RepID=UPI003ED0A087